MLLDCGSDRVNPLRECRTAESVQAGLGGHDLHDGKPTIAGLGEDDLDVVNGDGCGHGVLLVEGVGLPAGGVGDGGVIDEVGD